MQTIPSGDNDRDRTRPLADRMRPRTLDEFVGQEHLVAPGKPLRTQLERDDIGSLIFWGPPGTGKTTLAQIIARMTKAEFIEFSAVLTGIKEIPRPSWAQTPVSQIMMPLPRLDTIPPDARLWSALEKMGRDGVNQLPVVQGNGIVGMLSRDDLVQYLGLLRSVSA